LPKGAVGFETVNGPPQYARLGVNGESVPTCGEVQDAAAVLATSPPTLLGVTLGGVAADPGIVTTIVAITKQRISAKLVFLLSRDDSIRT